MKKSFLTLAILSATISFASAQILPSVQFGIKGGTNLTNISTSGSGHIFDNQNRAGYLGGFWARFGALGFNFQPEIYLTSKNVDVSNDNGETKAQFTSVDVPLLFGGKIGAFGLGGRFYTGPVISFAVNKDQSVVKDLQNAVSLDYKNQNFAWQFGAGIDIRKISLDVRYEAGITKQDYGDGQTRINLFSLALAYRLF